MSNLPIFQAVMTANNTDVAVDWKKSEIGKLRKRYTEWFTKEPAKELEEE